MKKLLSLITSLLFLFSIAYSNKPEKAQPEITIINDIKIEKTLVEEGFKVLQEKKYVKTKELVKQLKNTKAKIKINDAWEFSKSADELYQKSSRSVLTITSIRPCKEHKCHTSSASGFVISENGAAVTNYHVLDTHKKSETLIAMNAQNEVFKITAVLAADKEADVAIVELDYGKSKFTPLPLAKRAKIGEKVNIISHPAGHYFILTNGIAARYSSDKENDGVYWLCVTAEYAKGSSGSPVFNQYGQIVGVVSKTDSIYYTEKKDEPKADLQMVLRYTVPTQAIFNLIQKEGKQLSLKK